MSEVKNGVPLVKQLGIDVTLESEHLEKNPEANGVLHRIGTDMCPPGMNYAGTIAIHLYVESNHISKPSYSIANITNIAMKRDLSEQLIATAMNNATISIRQHFNSNYTYKTTRKGDTRGSVK
jgi:hypothetical protein